jgi:membrane-associated phospholipid phosphatase
MFFIVALAINYFASIYAADRVSLPVTDIILSNVRAMDVDGLIVYLAFFLVGITIYEVLMRPRVLPFVLKSMALFILIRSVFISLTHIGPFPTIDKVPFNSIISLGLGNSADLFFSGHTGMPFLAALIFWKNEYLRYIYLAGSIVLGVAVLLGHLHYSIDVLAAYFITFTIFNIAKTIFPKDWDLFNFKYKKIKAKGYE